MQLRKKQNVAGSQFDEVFDRLKAMLQDFESDTLKPHTDKSGMFSLIGPPMGNYKDGTPLAAVRKGKGYVAYHLPSVYAFPELLGDLSPELLKRMQGKACFGFKTVEEPLFRELSALTRKGFETFKQRAHSLPWAQKK